ncbi:MAG: DUF2914 domain-containing protein [Polyangiales bacterium]
MNIKSRVVVPIMLTVIGCTEPDPPTAGAIERAKSSESTLTSTVAPASPEARLVKTPEPVEREAIDASPEAEKRSFEPDLQSVDGLGIQRLVTTSEIADREPVAVSSAFSADEDRVYAFVEVSNRSDQAKVLMAHFIGPDGQVSGGIELRIPAMAPRWRTWAYTRHARDPGLWRVEIRGPEGSLLGALPFEVDPVD